LLSEDDLRRMSPDERLRLLRALVALDSSEAAEQTAGRRRRAIVLTAIVACCVILAAWIAVLALTLPPYYRAGDWRGAWVGFDVALLATFAVTGWAAWRRRQILVICLVVLATLLCCDAWFDVVLNAHTKGFQVSLLSALVIELPLAVLAIAGARRLLRMTVAIVRRYEGHQGPPPGLRQAHLVGGAPGSDLRDLFHESAETGGGPPDPRRAARAAERPGRPGQRP
jgi:hypothetical protein